MKINVDVLYINMEIKTYSINLNKSDNLEQAKDLLKEKIFVYPEEQIWFYSNTNIENLKDMKWTNNSSYQVLVNNKWYNFSVNTLTNSTINIKKSIISTNKINQIKKIIYDKIKLLSNKYILTSVINDQIIELKDNDFVGKYFEPIDDVIKINIHLV